jgi:hypothetical protein
VSKRWYNYFVSTDQAGGPEQGDTQGRTAADELAALAASVTEPAPALKQAAGAAQPRAPRQTVAEVAARVVQAPAPKFKNVAATASFEDIYQAAEIKGPPHGYSITKVAEMLESEHIRSLPPKVKRSSVLVALEAAGVKLEEVIQDAVARDRALDTYERVQDKSVADLETRKLRENKEIQAEIDRLVAEHQARIQANEQEVARERERLEAWRARKHVEEQRIADAVSHFVLENPITTSGSGASAPAAGSQSAEK